MKLQNRIIALLCAVILVLTACLCGCSSASAPAGTFAPEDAALLFRGQPVRCEDDAAALLALLGSNYEYSESISCNYAHNGINGEDGMDKFFDFADVSVTTCPMLPGGDYISSIEVWAGADWTSTKNVGIGCTLADIEAAYGKGYVSDGGMYIYYTDISDPASSQLYFLIENGEVTAFGIA